MLKVQSIYLEDNISLEMELMVFELKWDKEIDVESLTFKHGVYIQCPTFLIKGIQWDETIGYNQ